MDSNDKFESLDNKEKIRHIVRNSLQIIKHQTQILSENPDSVVKEDIKNSILIYLKNIEDSLKLLINIG